MIADEKILIEAGLSEEQALVYGTLLDRGPMKASALSTWVGVKRGLVYKVLEQLEAMNLVEKKGGEGTVALFAPLHPSRLLDIIEARAKSILLTKETLTYSLGALSSKFNLLSGKPNVQFYEGLEAIKFITGDLPNMDTEVRQFLDMEKAMGQFPEETIDYMNKRVKAGVAKRMILPRNNFNIEYAKKGTPLTEFRVVGKPFPTAVQIYDNKVSMLTLNDNKKIGLIIEDADIAQTFKTIFDDYWEGVAKSEY